MSRRDECHHAARRTQTGPGALDQAAHSQVSQSSERTATCLRFVGFISVD